MRSLQELIDKIDYEVNHNPAPVGDGGSSIEALEDLLRQALPHLTSTARRLPDLSTLNRYAPPAKYQIGMHQSDGGCWLHIGDLYSVDEIITDDRRRRGES